MRSRALTFAITAVLALPSAALAQSAGDDQYQDPFGESGASTSQGQSGSSESSGLSQTPDLGGSSAGAGASAEEERILSGEVSGTPAASELPATGAEPRILALAGLALLLGGIGLRLRTADETF